jgi:ribonuclease D
MASLNLPKHTYITTQTSWQRCLADLRNVSQFAIDLESNGLHAYSEEICLIQISTRKTDYIIDPQGEFELDDLGELIENPTIEKVLHASEYDIILMQREQGWRLNHLFDTMWGARILGHERIGLANVLAEFYDLELDKKYQRHNWCQRPLTRDELAYAQADTHFLLQLRDDMEARLREMGRWEETLEIFEEQSSVKLPDVSFSADSFWQINGAYDLPPRNRAILRELAIFRDEEAYRRNRPHFKIMGNKTLLQLAEHPPRHLSQLYDVKGMTSRQVQRYGRKLLDTIAIGRKAPIPRPPRRPERPRDDVLTRYEALHNWRKEKAIERGVASDVVLTRVMLWEIAEIAPKSSADLNMLGKARHTLYANEIVAVLQNL